MLNIPIVNRAIMSKQMPQRRGRQHPLRLTTLGQRRSGLLASCAFVAGALALSAAPAFAGCNSGNAANTNLLSSAACQATASGESATAVGFGAVALGINATAMGANTGTNAAIAGAINVGAFSGVSGAGIYSTAVGGGNSIPSASHALGAYSIAIGGSDDANILGARATGFRSIAIGPCASKLPHVA